MTHKICVSIDINVILRGSAKLARLHTYTAIHSHTRIPFPSYTWNYWPFSVLFCHTWQIKRQTINEQHFKVVLLAWERHHHRFTICTMLKTNIHLFKQLHPDYTCCCCCCCIWMLTFRSLFFTICLHSRPSIHPSIHFVMCILAFDSSMHYHYETGFRYRCFRTFWLTSLLIFLYRRKIARFFAKN